MPVGKYAVFGSGPVCVRGLRNWGDIDLIVTEELFENLKADSINWIAGVSKSGSEKLNHVSYNIEVWRDWKPGDWSIVQLISEAEVIGGVPFVKLGTVRDWKAARGSEKDQVDIKLIDEYLAKLSA